MLIFECVCERDVCLYAYMSAYGKWAGRTRKQPEARKEGPSGA